MSITPLKFTGISSFSDDFQTIVDRTVSIASLPVRALEAYQTEILSDKSGLGALSTAVSSLTSNLSALAGMKSGGALTVSSSSNKVNASIGSGASIGTYVLSDVTSLAQSAVYTASAGMADTSITGVDSDGVLNLVIDGVDHEIRLGQGENSLAGLRDAINGAGLGVSATIVDKGSGPNRFYLTLTAEQPGEHTYELRTERTDTATNLIAETRGGSDAKFKLNGIPVTSKDNYVSGAIAGVGFYLRGMTDVGEQIELSVNTDRGPVVTALSRFASSFNDLAATLNLHRGEAGGSLSGSGIVLDLSTQMMALTGVSGSGTVKNLTGLGLTLGADGVMSFDSSVISSMSSASFSSALDFMASETDGLAAIKGRFEQFSNPVTGYIQNEVSLLNLANQRYSEQISKTNERIEAMQASLLMKLQAADALLATLDSQKSMLGATIESLNTVTNGRREG